MYKILIVDNRPDKRASLKEILELAHYQTAEAQNGQEALQRVEKERPDLILCKAELPELNGYELLRLLSKDPELVTMAFVFTCPEATPKDIRRGMNLGADDFLREPYSKMELIDTVEARLSRIQQLSNRDEKPTGDLLGFMDEVTKIKGLEDLSEGQQRRDYKKREVVFHEGDPAHHLYYVLKGRVKLIKTDHYGKELINEFIDQKQFFGYLALMKGEEFHQTAVCLEPSEIVKIPKTDFWALLHRNRQVAERFIAMLANDTVEQKNRLLRMAFGTVKERLASVLLELHKKYNPQDSNTVKLKITRESLAGMVGTTTESLIRTLSELKEGGFIEVSGREICLLRKAALQQMAG